MILVEPLVTEVSLQSEEQEALLKLTLLQVNVDVGASFQTKHWCRLPQPGLKIYVGLIYRTGQISEELCWVRKRIPTTYSFQLCT